MNRTLVGRITFLRGIRHQVETYIRQVSDLGPYAPIVVPVLLYVFAKTYQNEQRNMREERVRALKQEKAQYDRVERQLVRELREAPAEGARRWFGRRAA
jgi:hypothetical protein